MKLYYDALQRRSAAAGRHAAPQLGACLPLPAAASAQEEEDAKISLFSSWIGKALGIFHSKTTSQQYCGEHTQDYTLVACADDFKKACRFERVTSLLKAPLSEKVTEALEKYESLLSGLAKQNPLSKVKKPFEQSNALNWSSSQGRSLHQCRTKQADPGWNCQCTYGSVENCTRFCSRGPYDSCAKWWRGQVGFTPSVAPQQWSTRLFSRSLSMKSRLNRKKRDLARREFQLLRRKTKLMKASLSPEEKLLWRLRKANRKKAVLLQRLKKFELEEEPEPIHDPELITQEQLHALKKIGYKNRNYVPVGRRGVFGGVVLNMHMHWKFHETVQVDCHIYKRESVKEVAKKLAILSGGIVIDIHQATNIIMYRGRNYKQPKQEMTPPNTLTKRKALFQSKYLQALEALENHTKEMEAELQKLRRQKKESDQEGGKSGDSKFPQNSEGSHEMESISETGQSEVPTDDEEDDHGVFSWDSDSLDEDELSDEDEFNFKKAEEMQLQNKKTTSKPMSWTFKESAQRCKVDARTASELVKAEQDLFKQGPKRPLTNGGWTKGNRKVGALDAKLDRELKTDDDDDDNEKGLEHDSCVERENIAITDTKQSMIGKDHNEDDILEHDSWERGVITNTKAHAKIGTDSPNARGMMLGVSRRSKTLQQIKNKKIASFVEGWMTDDKDGSDEFDSDIDDVQCNRENVSGRVED